METNKIYEGTCLDVIKTFPDKSIDCVITSPPYWQLRDYGWDGQWGQEPDFNMYLEHLWELMDEIYRVLKDEGTCWINLGDTYGGTSPKKNVELGKLSYIGRDFKGNSAISKCLLLIPHRFAIGCIDRGWIMRNDIIWAKRNGMPESVTDRFSKKHEYFFFMVKSEKYNFDLDSIRGKHSQVSLNRDKYGRKTEYEKGFASVGRTYEAGEMCNPMGKNPGSVSDFWDILTKPNKDKHYASYNTELIDKPIIAGCPKGGIILDPFCGTATTGCRAIQLQRKFIGIEGSKEYVNLANKKLHPFIISKQLFS